MECVVQKTQGEGLQLLFNETPHEWKSELQHLTFSPEEKKSLSSIYSISYTLPSERIHNSTSFSCRCVKETRWQQQYRKAERADQYRLEGTYRDNVGLMLLISLLWWEQALYALDAVGAYLRIMKFIELFFKILNITSFNCALSTPPTANIRPSQTSGATILQSVSSIFLPIGLSGKNSPWVVNLTPI